VPAPVTGVTGVTGVTRVTAEAVLIETAQAAGTWPKMLA
jgi:hypothetical protein